MWVLALERPAWRLDLDKLKSSGVICFGNSSSCRTTEVSFTFPEGNLLPLARDVSNKSLAVKKTKKRELRSGESKLRRFHQLSSPVILSARAELVRCAKNESEPVECGELWSEAKKGVVWTAEEIAQAVDGILVQSAGPGCICTDSRKIEPGDWFLPLVGSNFDGHDFLQQAFDRGCHGVVGRAVDPDWKMGFVSVKNGDTLGALHRLAACVRERYQGSVVGITGSVGKTTARTMTVLALESLGLIHGTEGNFNNHVGLPLTLLKLPFEASSCVLEMGMSNAGEIQQLVEIARPSVRVLMNVGLAHMENFRSLEDVAAAKAEILSKTRSGDVCVMNADDPLVMSLPLPPKVRLVLFGRQIGCHIRIASAQAIRNGTAVHVKLEQWYPSYAWVENSTSGFRFLETLRELSMTASDERAPSNAAFMNNENEQGASLQHSLTDAEHNFAEVKWSFPSAGLNLHASIEFDLPSPGLHLAVSACVAAAVAVSLGVPLEAVGASLSRYVAPTMRAKREELGWGIQLIDDAYNANPMSMTSSLMLLGSMTCPGRRVALLGDMLELGAATNKAHLDVLELCQEQNFEMVGLAGPFFSEAAHSRRGHRADQEYIICQTSEELSSQVAGTLKSGDVVLVKGSRGLRMDMVANAVREKCQQR